MNEVSVIVPTAKCEKIECFGYAIKNGNKYLGFVPNINAYNIKTYYKIPKIPVIEPEHLAYEHASLYGGKVVKVKMIIEEVVV